MESVLPVRLTVTSPRVAAQAGQCGQDILRKVPRSIVPRIDRYSGNSLLTFRKRLDRDRPSRQGAKIAARLELCMRRRLNSPLRCRGQIARSAIGILRHEQELQTRVVSRYGSRFRSDLEGRLGRGAV